MTKTNNIVPFYETIRSHQAGWIKAYSSADTSAPHGSLTRQHPVALIWNNEWLNSRPIQTKRKLLNNFHKCHLSKQYPCTQSTAALCFLVLDVPMSPMGAVRGQRGPGRGYMNKISNKTRKLWPAGKLKIRTRWAAHVRNYQMNTRSWCTGSVYAFLPFHEPLIDTSGRLRSANTVSMGEGYVKVEQSQVEQVFTVKSPVSVKAQMWKCSQYVSYTTLLLSLIPSYILLSLWPQNISLHFKMFWYRFSQSGKMWFE